MELPNTLYSRLSESSISYIEKMNEIYPATVELVYKDLQNEFIFKLTYETIVWLGSNLLRGQYNPAEIYSLFEENVEEKVGS